MVVVGARVVVDGSGVLGAAVDSDVEELSSVAAEVDSDGSWGVCSVDEGFSASGSVVSGLPLPSVVSGAEVELEPPSVGSFVTSGASDGSEGVLASGAAVSAGED